MSWLSEHWKPILKWAGVGLSALVVLLGAFVGARYMASGGEYAGSLEQLAPPNTVMVVHIASVPGAKAQADGFLDEVVRDSRLPLLENSAIWRERFGKVFEGGLARFQEETVRQALDDASRQADAAGVKLFDDALAGELLLCADEGKDPGFVALSRVSRAVRFRWQFMDFAGMFLPDGPAAPEIEYADGVLTVTPRAADDAKPRRTLRITLVEDVLIVSDSARLFDASLAARDGGASLAQSEPYQRARKAPSEDDAARFTATLWIDLDGLRARMPVGEDGQSPVDGYASLPSSAVSIYPDVMVPLDTIVSRNLDTTVFSAAYYGIDLSDPDTLRFDQYLLADLDRAGRGEYEYLRDTWSQPARQATQLKLLPPDTMCVVSYRQPLELLYNQVFTDRDRNSLVGDFVRAARGEAVKSQLKQPIEELLFATAPRTYAPDAVAPVSPVELPLPAFTIGFRTRDANEEVARGLLDDYLMAQRGRSSKPNEAPRAGAASVVETALEGRRIWALDDPRDEPGNKIIPALNRSIRCALVGEWLLLTNSEPLLAYALRAQAGREKGLSAEPDSAFQALDSSNSATVYLNWDAFANYATNEKFFTLLRGNKFNPGLIDMRDQKELRLEIVEQMGLDPSDVRNMTDSRVAAEYERRLKVWENICKVEGDRYVADLQGNFSALKFFRDFAMTTRFLGDSIHVKGVLRIG